MVEELISTTTTVEVVDLVGRQDGGLGVTESQATVLFKQETEEIVSSIEEIRKVVTCQEPLPMAEKPMKKLLQPLTMPAKVKRKKGRKTAELPKRLKQPEWEEEGMINHHKRRKRKKVGLSGGALKQRSHARGHMSTDPGSLNQDFFTQGIDSLSWTSALSGKTALNSAGLAP